MIPKNFHVPDVPKIPAKLTKPTAKRSPVVTVDTAPNRPAPHRITRPFARDPSQRR